MGKVLHKFSILYRHFLIACIIIIFCLHSNGQNNTHSVSGRVMSSEGIELPFATVKLIRRDQPQPYIVLTDSTGHYIFRGIHPGIYTIQVSLASYELKTIQEFHVETNQVLPVIQLTANIASLSTAIVISKKMPAEYKDGKLVVQIASSLQFSGSNGAELFEQLPGVTLDSDGNILFNGKSGVKIMIDNNLIPLSGEQLLNFLQTKVASQIERIELISNPTSQSDASGTAGIIHILTKKQRTDLFYYNSTGTFTQGIYPKANVSLATGYKKDKWNLHLSFNGNHAREFAKPRITRTYPGSDPYLFYQLSDQLIQNKSLNITARADYSLSKKTMMGLSVLSSFQKSINNNLSTSYFSDVDRKLLFYSDFKGEHENHNNNYSINFNFRHDLDTSGKKLFADVDYFRYNQKNYQAVTSRNFDANDYPIGDLFSLKGRLPVFYNVYSMRLDYMHPFSSNIKSEAGVKISKVNNDGAAQYYLFPNGQPLTDSSRSNRFLYSEQINAAYVNTTIKANSWQFHLGLRAEKFFFNGNQLATNEQFSNSYIKFFSSFFVAYTSPEKFTVNFTGSKRIDRPEYQDLNPFKYFIDMYTYRQGNQLLKPSYSNNLEINFSKSGSYLLSVFYNHVNNNITRVILRSADTSSKVAYQTTTNLGYRNNYGVNLYMPINFTKWWLGTFNFQYFQNTYTGDLDNGVFDQHMKSYTINTTQSIKFNTALRGEVSLIYRSPVLYGTFRNKHIYNLSMAVSKNFKNNRYSVKLLANDILYTWERRFTIQYGNLNMNYTRRNDTRYLRIVFTYSFNKATISRSRPNSSEEETRRLGGSDN